MSSAPWLLSDPPPLTLEADAEPSDSRGFYIRDDGRTCQGCTFCKLIGKSFITSGIEAASGEHRCRFVRQPRSWEEIRFLVDIISTGVCRHIRYAGTRPEILGLLRDFGVDGCCDHPPPEDEEAGIHAKSAFTSATRSGRKRAGKHSPTVALLGASGSDPLLERIFFIMKRLGITMLPFPAGQPMQKTVAGLNLDLIILRWTPETRKELEAWARTEEAPHVPVLTVAEAPTLEEVASMIESGVDDCIRDKTPDDLILARIKNALGARAATRRHIEKAEKVAMRDSLTGLWNHSQFREMLRLEIERSKRSQAPVALVMIDVDYFKKVNDEIGHAAGDTVLKEIAFVIGAMRRSGDVAARYGGEEFSVILPGADRSAALRVAERMRRAVERLELRHGTLRIHKTISLGVAVYPDDAVTSSDLAESSDRGLLQAKRTGRNRVESVRWVDFAYRSPMPCRLVSVAGDWDAWNPLADPLVRVEESAGGEVWAGRVLLPTGKSRYKFRVHFQGADAPGNYRWLSDPANSAIEPDGFGGQNSIIEVERF